MRSWKPPFLKLEFKTSGLLSSTQATEMSGKSASELLKAVTFHRAGCPELNQYMNQ